MDEYHRMIISTVIRIVESMLEDEEDESEHMRDGERSELLSLHRYLVNARNGWDDDSGYDGGSSSEDEYYYYHEDDDKENKQG